MPSSITDAEELTAVIDAGDLPYVAQRCSFCMGYVVHRESADGGRRQLDTAVIVARLPRELWPDHLDDGSYDTALKASAAAASLVVQQTTIEREALLDLMCASQAGGEQ